MSEPQKSKRAMVLSGGVLHTLETVAMRRGLAPVDALRAAVVMWAEASPLAQARSVLKTIAELRRGGDPDWAWLADLLGPISDGANSDTTTITEATFDLLKRRGCFPGCQIELIDGPWVQNDKLVDVVVDTKGGTVIVGMPRDEPEIKPVLGLVKAAAQAAREKGGD